MLARAHPVVITRSDYEVMPEGPPYYQLIEGEIVMSPSPLTVHQRIVGRLFAVLHNHVQEHGLGEVFLAPLDVFLNDINVYQPDIAFVSTARSKQVSRRGIDGAPDLCIEVLSSSTGRYDRGAKKKVCAQAGVTEYWLIDPKRQSVAIYLLQSDADKPAHEARPPQMLRPEIFPGLKIPLRQIFESAS